jgi:hypothetical protein
MFHQKKKSYRIGDTSIRFNAFNCLPVFIHQDFRIHIFICALFMFAFDVKGNHNVCVDVANIDSDSN